MINIKRVTDYSELSGIQLLQQQNLRTNLSPEESSIEGFVTAEYSLAFLEKMHHAGPSIIAKEDELVVGYALVADKSIRHEHNLLAGLFDVIDETNFNGSQLKNVDYVVVGQLCVAKSFRGKGLVNQMYDYYKNCLVSNFQYCITDIAQENVRSLKAHLKTGFEVINTLDYGGKKWDIVLWKWY